MLAEHRSAYSAALYGLIAIALFLAPLFIYSGEYSDNEKQNRGNKAGDLFSMVSQGLGIHVGLLFFFSVGFEIIDLIMKAVPSLQPSAALKTFFLIGEGSGDTSDFIRRWMSSSHDTSGGGAPINEVAQKSFSIFMVSVGLALTLLFMAIPLMVLSAAIKIGLTPDPQDDKGASLISSVLRAASFFIGATLLLLVHSLIASSLVMLMTKTSSFSYFAAMQKIWSYILFGGA